MNENINFFLNEDSNNDLNDNNNVNDSDLTDILNEINSDKSCYFEQQNTDNLFHEVVNYNINYTVKQLLLICDYYNILKEVKMTKCNKEEIINTIVLFESESHNYNIVCIRKKLWFYINELKKDKFMKKFILWN
uniref:Uncharacterized protein n=1 Tax=viral metagenome TaxID=1070528 RepID=A0A6C0IHG2_9ZZZZ